MNEGDDQVPAWARWLAGAPWLLAVIPAPATAWMAFSLLRGAELGERLKGAAMYGVISTATLGILVGIARWAIRRSRS